MNLPLHLFCIASLLHLIHFTNSQPSPFFICVPYLTYTPLSPYHRSLNTTLSSLARNASRTGYFTTSTRYASAVSYGLVQCRGYISSKDCTTCATALSTAITQLCPNIKILLIQSQQKEASICDEQCTLQYADWDFFSTPDVLPRIMLRSPVNFSYPDAYNVHLQGFLTNLSSKAATDPSKLAFGRSRYTDFQYVYSMVQCALDISATDCANCLRVASEYIPRFMADTAAGVRLFAFSCNLRYEIYPFFRLQISPPASSSLPPSLPPNSTNGYGKNSKNRAVVLVTVPVSVLVLVCATVYYFLRVKASSINPDPKRRVDLDWGTRYNIVIGVARGLLYLHEDSQLRIIHRDLKASNILLDESMSPKISDFGLARLFHGNETQGDTSQIAGTYGYMAPEYARHGHFSIKSDVYSFGILLLELVWDHWSKGVALQLSDPAMANRYSNVEVLKCIHIGLLCVQESFADRPTMSEVVMMLSNHTVSYPTPLQPAFFLDRRESFEEDDDNDHFKSEPFQLNYTSGSRYQLNLRLALTSLTANASHSDYITTSVGQRPDSVYAQLQCRGYTPPDACQVCASNLAAEIIQTCPNQKQSSIDSDKCSLRYSDINFFSIMDSDTSVYQYNFVSGTDLVALGSSLERLLKSLSPSAAASASRVYSGITSYMEGGNIYAMVQCSKGISQGDCVTCLDSIAMRYVVFLNKMGQGRNFKTMMILLLIGVAFVLLLITGIYSFLFLWKKMRNTVGDSKRSLELLLIEFDKLRQATNNFSDKNKLGQGGFGPVYKGKMRDGQEIAVKRLSSSSKQGLEELQTEVMFVAKLMHQNLVRLVGFCIEEEEKLLVYEYLPNGSLDKFLFDEKRRLKLTWEMRYNIIVGIARGLLYLHEEHPLKIIHRDLKASNVLLDESMSPKISDFGLARLFPGSKNHCFTNRIIGTYGYMAPEYAVRGRYSTKSDVYSFGILVLEIITGRKNSSFQDSRNLQSYAWKHWINGTALKILDPAIGEEFKKDEVLKCINIGLLSVQEAAEKRPTMSDVVLKLGCYTKLCPSHLLTGLSDAKNITAPDSSNEDSEITGILNNTFH
ncbi:Cysteine-rich receptor-like protein kinase 10 [Linum grandiflorum]